MRYGNGGMDGGWAVAMMLGMMAVVVLVTALIVWLVLSSRSPGAAPVVVPGGAVNRTTAAEQILAERLARGEIDAAEYQQRLDALRSSGSA